MGLAFFTMELNVKIFVKYLDLLLCNANKNINGQPLFSLKNNGPESSCR